MRKTALLTGLGVLAAVAFSASDASAVPSAATTRPSRYARAVDRFSAFWSTTHVRAAARLATTSALVPPSAKWSLPSTLNWRALRPMNRRQLMKLLAPLRDNVLVGSDDVFAGTQRPFDQRPCRF